MAEEELVIKVVKNTLKTQSMKDKIIKICKEIIPIDLTEEDADDTEKELRVKLEKELGGCFKVFFGNSNSAGIKCDQFLNLNCELADDETIGLIIYFMNA